MTDAVEPVATWRKVLAAILDFADGVLRRRLRDRPLDRQRDRTRASSSKACRR